MRKPFLALLLATQSFVFSIPAVAAELVFTASGDFGGNANTRAALNLLAAQKTSFHLALGDLSYGEITPERAWCDFVKASIGPTFPFQLIPGNHDTPESNDGDIQKFAACFPHRIDNLVGNYPIRYYFDHPGTGAKPTQKRVFKPLARFIIVSPGIDFGNVVYRFKKGDGDYTWLAEAIADARKDGIRWIIVSMHKNCLSVGDKSCEVGTDIMDLLHEKKVDLILQGHDHTYSRTYPLKCLKPKVFDAKCVGSGKKDEYRQGDGTITLIAGTGGISLYRVRERDSEAPYFVKFSGKNSDDASYGFMKFRLTANELKAEFVTAKAAAKTPLKDSFVISADSAAAPITN